VWTNWLGVKSRIDRAPISMEYCVLRDRPQEADIPYLGTYKLLDWATIFEAVLSAGDPFIMVSVGAGYGLFACTSAFAAMQTGRTYRLVGVEAEPQHVEWMEEHFQDNGLDPQWYRLIRAAASGRSGAHWFPMDAPHEYGRAVLPDLAVPGVPPGSVPLWGEIEHAGQRFQRVPAVTIGDILSGLPSADYVEVDIQGTEFEFLSAQPDILQEGVRMLRVQTHSSATDRKMHRLFSDLGWISRYAAPFNSEVTASLGNGVTRCIRFGDGVQTWINPRIHS
jgi:FkbM family methyltransferase